MEDPCSFPRQHLLPWKSTPPTKQQSVVEERVYIHRALHFLVLEGGEWWDTELEFFLHLNSK